MADAPKIRHTADIPQQLDRRPVGAARGHLGTFSKRFQRQHVIGFARAHESAVRRRRLQRSDKRIYAAKLQRMIAPLQLVQRGKPVIHDRLCHPILKRPDIPCDAKSAILLSPSGAACDLGQLVRGQRTHAPPIKFRERRKGNMVNVQIQPHANRICRNQKINLAILIHVDLRIARARTERTHDNGRPPLLTADQLSDSIDIINGKSDNGRARTHAADLFLPRIDQL